MLGSCVMHMELSSLSCISTLRFLESDDNLAVVDIGIFGYRRKALHTAEGEDDDDEADEMVFVETIIRRDQTIVHFTFALLKVFTILCIHVSLSPALLIVSL